MKKITVYTDATGRFRLTPAGEFYELTGGVHNDILDSLAISKDEIAILAQFFTDAHNVLDRGVPFEVFNEE